jgi:hypothetical protein
MEPTTHTAASSISIQVASSTLPDSPAELSDAELLSATRRLVGRSNQLLASLLAHLGEVEARGIHRVRACASLYAYWNLLAPRRCNSLPRRPAGAGG